ncbi:MAG: helix-turn-helix transcriptional regulator [Alistipes sp.]|nr:helix-turn-helix transcriptional regulator [Alistipes sp.]
MTHISRVAKIEGGKVLNLKHKLLGIVASGTMMVYSANHCVEIGHGKIFLLCEGLHYAVDSPDSDGNPFKAVTIEITPQIVQRALVSLINNDEEFLFSRPQSSCCTASTSVLVCNPTKDSVNALLSTIQACISHRGTSAHITNLMHQLLRNQCCPICGKLFNRAEIERARFVSHIHGSLLSNATIEHLAEQNNCSATTFKSQFRELFNATPHKWQVEQRIHLARALLLSTALTITQIGEICSFSHTSHFIRLFKQHYHLTPHAYRRKNGGGG